AEKLIEDVRVKAAEIQKQAEIDGKETAENLMNEAKKEGEGEAEKLISGSKKEADGIKKRSKDKVGGAADAIVKSVLEV
ncbi:MAG: hypothetical protein V3V63_01070, partial [Candidatus Hydrothermarchaeaceae archaeon]